MLNKRIAIILIVSAVAIFSIIAGISSITTPSETISPKAGLRPPPSPIMDYAKTPVASIEEAKALTNSKVDIPTYLPAGYDIDVINITPDGKTATILASPKQITGETTDYDFFWVDKGILIYFQERPPDYNWERDNPSYAEPREARPITINGKSAVVHGQKVVTSITGEKVPVISELLFYHEGWTVEIRADLPEGELIRIAQSMYR